MNINNFLKQIKDRWFEVIILFLLLFVPLYPKLPLFDISFSWTYIRLEDVLFAASYLILGILIIKNKPNLKNFLFWPILTFWLVGLISTVWALFTLGSIDNWVTFKPHLIVIHYLRRIEYLSALFLVYVGIKDRVTLKRFILILIIGLVGVIVYGFGQKFGGFCSYLTMNEEFAKGTCIPLQVGTRISSTFGGHYDLAGYLVLLLPIIGSLFFFFKDKYKKIILALIFIAGFVVLTLTSSRISFLALFVALGVLAWFLVKKKSVLIIGVIAVSLLTFIVGQNTIIDRLVKTIRVKPVVIEKSTGKILETPTTQKDWGGLPESDRVFVLPFQTGEATNSAYKVMKYTKGDLEKMKEASLAVSTKVIEVPNTGTTEQSENDKKEIIEEVRVINGEFIKKNALVFDISFTTRIDGGWPNALKGFKYNPIIGRGYSTVTAAVDSSYVRALGEVGILGFISFFAIFIIFLKKSFKYISLSTNQLNKAYVLGVTAGIIGLLVNGLLIDIFEASKVAFIMWMIMGSVVWIVEKESHL